MTQPPGNGRAPAPFVDNDGDVWSPVPDPSRPAPAPQPSGRHRSPRDRVALIWGVVALVAVVVLVGAGLRHLVGGASGPDDVIADTPLVTIPTVPTFTTPPVPARPRSCDGVVARPGPRTPPGWRTVRGTWGLNYDVPTDWTVHPCTTIVGWEHPCENGPFGYCVVRALDSSAAQRSSLPGCVSKRSVMSGFGGASRYPDIHDALDVEKRTVKRIYTPANGRAPLVELGSEREITVAGRPAVHRVATVTEIDAKRCVGGTALHSMVATTVPGQRGSVVFVISLGQVGPAAPDPTVIDRIVATLRPAS